MLVKENNQSMTKIINYFAVELLIHYCSSSALYSFLKSLYFTNLFIFLHHFIYLTPPLQIQTLKHVIFLSFIILLTIKIKLQAPPTSKFC